MKITKIWLMAVLALVIGVSAEGATNVHPLNNKGVSRVATFTKVWGLMKYYHPEVAAGSIDWDSVFVAYLPKVMEVKNQQQFHELMEEVYEVVPAPKLAGTYNLPKADTIVAIFSADEITAYNVSLKLKQQLKNMYERHLPLESKYITNKYKEYTLDYVRFLEDPMAEAAYPDQAKRLLALARYWNAINFFYPHKQTIGKDWEKVLVHNIPAFADAPNELAYHQAILRLNKELKDSHTFVSSPILNAMWGPNPYFQVSYVERKFVVTKILVDSLAQAQDVKVGDVITAINGKPVKERVKELWAFMVNSNEAATCRDIANYLLNVDSNSYATLEIQRNGSRLSRKVNRYPYQELVKLSDKPIKEEKQWREVGRGIMYVDYTKIAKPDMLRGLFIDLQNSTTVILDLRGYPNFEVFRQTLPALYEKSFIASFTTTALVQYPGLFSVSKSMYEHFDTSTLVPYKGNMIVLVNETTQSLPESFAMGLSQRPNTIIMGSQTAGTTGNVTWLPLPGGANIAFTGTGEHGAKGTFEQRKGVKIDKVVKPTVASIAAGKDAVLDAAVEQARKNMAVRAEVNR